MAKTVSRAHVLEAIKQAVEKVYAADAATGDDDATDDVEPGAEPAPQVHVEVTVASVPTVHAQGGYNIQVLNEGPEPLTTYDLSPSNAYAYFMARYTMTKREHKPQSKLWLFSRRNFDGPDVFFRWLTRSDVDTLAAAYRSGGARQPFEDHDRFVAAAKMMGSEPEHKELQELVDKFDKKQWRSVLDELRMFVRTVRQMGPESTVRVQGRTISRVGAIGHRKAGLAGTKTWAGKLHDIWRRHTAKGCKTAPNHQHLYAPAVDNIRWCFYCHRPDNVADADRAMYATNRYPKGTIAPGAEPWWLATWRTEPSIMSLFLPGTVLYHNNKPQCYVTGIRRAGLFLKFKVTPMSPAGRGDEDLPYELDYDHIVAKKWTVAPAAILTPGLHFS